MILSKEFYDKCGPSYQKVVDELEKKIAEIEKCDDVTKSLKVISAIYQFSKRHLTPGEYWEHCKHHIELFPSIYFGICFGTNTYNSITTQCEKLCRDIVKRAYYYHFYLNKNWSRRFYWGSNYPKLDDFRYSSDWEGNTIYEHDLDYPHDCLKLCLREFEQQITKPPSKDLYKRCEEMISLYPKIKAAVGDIDEWFQLLLKVNNDKYLKDNIEFQIGHNLHDVKLWKIYINYLKQTRQNKYLLGIYSRYCRFFLDDDEMKKEYKEAMHQHGPVHLPWENLFEFEKSCGMEEAEDQYFTPEEADDTQSSKDLIPFDKSICRRFYDTYEVYQEFALPGPIVRYVLKNAGHQVLRKLFASCKWFFAKQQTPICYGFRTGQREIYKDESLTLNRHSKKESFPKNIYITGYINCRLSVLPKFYRCEAKFIDIRSCGHLSFDELKSLIGHGGVVKLKTGGCKLKDEKNECVALETIMEFLPNIVELHLNNVKITEKTPHALTSMKFNSKFERVYIYLISGEEFDTEEFSKFLIVNKSDQYFHCELTFCKKFNADFVQSLEKFMEEGPTSEYEKFEVNVDSGEEESGDELETDSNDSD